MPEFLSRFAALGVAFMVVGLTMSAHAIEYSEDVVTDRYVKRPCKVTPSVGTSNYPGFKNVLSNNKLAIPPGKALFAPGEVVYFFARVFDRNCVPISDAKIELWQANPEGKHRYASRDALATPDPTFAGAGRTSSTNLGEFTFVTLYPGPYEYTIYKTDDKGEKIPVVIKRAPHFNLTVSHPDFKSFSTNLFFFGDSRNATDHILKGMSDESKGRLMMRVTPRSSMGDWNEGVQATIDIVLPGKSKYRGF